MKDIEYELYKYDQSTKPENVVGILNPREVWPGDRVIAFYAGFPTLNPENSGWFPATVLRRYGQVDLELGPYSDQSDIQFDHLDQPSNGIFTMFFPIDTTEEQMEERIRWCNPPKE